MGILDEIEEKRAQSAIAKRNRVQAVEELLTPYRNGWAEVNTKVISTVNLGKARNTDSFRLVSDVDRGFDIECVGTTGRTLMVGSADGETRIRTVAEAWDMFTTYLAERMR